MPTTENKAREILVELAGIEPERITRGAHLFDDLGGDSLDRVEWVMEAEERFDIAIPDETADRLCTFGEYVDAIDAELANA